MRKTTKTVIFIINKQKSTMRKVVITESKLRKIVSESISKILNESIKSSRLKQWFQNHGGVKNTNEYGNENQDGLGDVTDDSIVYTDDFENPRDAFNIARNLRNDRNTFYRVYTANDGCAILVGLDRNKVDTGHTWGGERTKKSADRFWSNEPYTRDGRYKDDSGTYYTQPHSLSRDFGYYTNNGLKKLQNDLKNTRESYHNSEEGEEGYQKYRERELKDFRDYIDKYKRK